MWRLGGVMNSKSVMAGQSGRLHYLDTFRVAMLLLGIPYHTSEIFRTGGNWLVSSDVGSSLLQHFSHASHSFRMFAFFLVSGYFSSLVATKRGAGRWLQGRVLRLGVPLIACSLLLGPIEIALVANWRAAQTAAAGDFAAIYWEMLTHGDLWLMHRWFLVVLIIYSCLNMLILLPSVQRRITVLSGLLATYLDKAWVACCGVILVGLALYGVAEMVPFRYIPELYLGGTIPLLRIISYVPAFFIGAYLGVHPVTFERFTRFSIVSAIAAVGLTALYVATAEDQSTLGRVLFRLSVIPTGILVTQLLLSLTQRFLARQSMAVAVLVDAAFVIYLLHFAFLLGYSQFLLAPRFDPLGAFVAISAATAGSCIAFYFLVRRSWLAGWVFNGSPFKFSASPA